LEVGSYDFRYRFYDPQIGRFTSIDRFAEKYPYKTPYDYAENNPATGGDLDGLEFMNANLMQAWANPGQGWLDAKSNAGQTITPQNQSNASAITNAANSGTLLGAKALGYAALSIVASPAVTIPLMMTDLTGVPVTASPQAIATAPATAVDDAVSASTGELYQPADLPNSANVVRGGLCTATNFENGTGVTVTRGGTLEGVSVNSQQGATVGTLSTNIKNGKIGVTTVGEIRAAGGNIVPSPSNNDPTHAILSGITSGKAEELFNPVVSNPIKVPYRPGTNVSQ
jgi:hypothetical protein